MSFVLATPVISSPSKNTSRIKRERSWALRSSGDSNGSSRSSAMEMLLVGDENAWLELYSFSLLLTDDVSRHHAAARAYISQFRVGQTRKRRPDFAIEQERVEIHQLLGKLHPA